jgi:hypothetical protein
VAGLCKTEISMLSAQNCRNDCVLTCDDLALHPFGVRRGSGCGHSEPCWSRKSGSGGRRTRSSPSSPRSTPVSTRSPALWVSGTFSDSRPAKGLVVALSGSSVRQRLVFSNTSSGSVLTSCSPHLLRQLLTRWSRSHVEPRFDGRPMAVRSTSQRRSSGWTSGPTGCGTRVGGRSRHGSAR